MKGLNACLIVLCGIMFIGCSSSYEKGNEALKNKDYKDAIGYFEQVRENDKDYKDARKNLDDAYYFEGLNCFNKKTWQQAIDSFDKVSKDSKYYETSRKAINDAKDMSIKDELNKYASQKDISKIHHFIEVYSNTPYAQQAKRIEIALLKESVEQQSVFEENQAQFYYRYHNAVNEAKASLIFNDANGWSTEFANKHIQIFNWNGVLSSVTTPKGGDHANVKINSGMVTYKDAISITSPLYGKIAEIEIGRTVYFSGHFTWDRKGMIAEDSLTEGGRMKNPEFKINIADITTENVLTAGDRIGDTGFGQQIWRRFATSAESTDDYYDYDSNPKNILHGTVNQNREHTVAVWTRHLAGGEIVGEAPILINCTKRTYSVADLKKGKTGDVGVQLVGSNSNSPIYLLFREVCEGD